MLVRQLQRKWFLSNYWLAARAGYEDGRWPDGPQWGAKSFGTPCPATSASLGCADRASRETGLGDRSVGDAAKVARSPAKKKAICWPFVKASDGLEPSTLSYHRGSSGQARTCVITRDTVSPGNRRFWELGLRRETSRVSFLICPFCVRVALVR
jgi:hypothetical protein